MNSTSMSFVPRFPWNDDERDTSTFIEYYSSTSKNTHDKDNDTYIPTYQIMKEYFQEQAYELYYDNYQYDDWFENYGYEDWHLAYDYSNYDSETDIISDDGDCVVDCASKSDDEEDALQAEGNASSPYVSSKYWYT